MTRTPMLCVALILAGCGSDALTAGREALERGDHAVAVEKLHKAVASDAGGEAVVAYQQALKSYHEQLRRPNVELDRCDQAIETLTKLQGFADGGDEAEAEAKLLSQALLCAARTRARKGQATEAAEVVVRGIKQLPGFSPGSPVLAKALAEPAIEKARAGDVVEATALAQVFFSVGEFGKAIALIDLLEASGASADDIYPVLADRAKRATTSDAASALAASFATWHGHPNEAVQWYDQIAARSAKDGGTRARTLKRYASLRAKEASSLAAFSREPCSAGASPITVASKMSDIPAMDAEAVEGGLLVAWVEGDEAPQQKIKAVKVSAGGEVASAKVVANSLPRVKLDTSDVRAAFAPKNRETLLAVERCGEAIELVARGAPHGQWMRGALEDDGAVAVAPSPIGDLGPTGHMPSEDVWWNVGCANDDLVHVWLADNQLLRAAWFSGGQPAGDPSNLRVPGFSPWFEVVGAEDDATRLIWIDIMGEDSSQLLGVVIPDDREVPTQEESENADAEQLVENIPGRVEQMRVTEVGDRLAITYYPMGGDIMVRWMERAGRLLGNAAPVARLRADARGVRFDAAALDDRLGVAWTVALTEQWATLFFQSVGSDGTNPTPPQRVAGLVRPDISPVVTTVGDRFVVAWIDRVDAEGQALRAVMLRCDQ